MLMGLSSKSKDLVQNNHMGKSLDLFREVHAVCPRYFTSWGKRVLLEVSPQRAGYVWAMLG